MTPPATTNPSTVHTQVWHATALACAGNRLLNLQILTSGGYHREAETRRQEMPWIFQCGKRLRIR
jgi:hypothetical protein